MKNIDDILDKILPKFIPFFGDIFTGMSPEQKREYILKLAEVIARGVTEGTMRANK